MLTDNCCFIKEQYFIDHSHFDKMLDPGNISKQSSRTFVCVSVNIYNRTFYIPLRNHLGEPLRKYGIIGHSVPSGKRPFAGLDYRYTLMIDDQNYIEPHTSRKLPDTQYNIIQNDYVDIVKEFSVYLKGFIREYIKGRIQREPLYRESSLINYAEELKELYNNKH